VAETGPGAVAAPSSQLVARGAYTQVGKIRRGPTFITFSFITRFIFKAAENIYTPGPSVLGSAEAENDYETMDFSEQIARPVIIISIVLCCSFLTVQLCPLTCFFPFSG
jgi:hypothetical protein